MAQITPIINPSKRQVASAQQEAEQKARSLADTISGVKNADQALIREILPDADLETQGDNAWNGTDNEWVQSGLTANQVNHVYNINSNGAAQDKILVFYGVANVAADVLTTEVQFDDSTDARFFRVNTQPLEVADVSDFIIFDQPVAFGATEDGDINQWPNAAGDDAVVYLAKVAEQVGNTLATRETPESRLGQGRARR